MDNHREDPRAHDSACTAIDALGANLESVVIHKLENHLFSANVIIGTKEG